MGGADPPDRSNVSLAIINQVGTCDGNKTARAIRFGSVRFGQRAPCRINSRPKFYTELCYEREHKPRRLVKNVPASDSKPDRNSLRFSPPPTLPCLSISHVSPRQRIPEPDTHLLFLFWPSRVPGSMYTRVAF